MVLDDNGQLLVFSGLDSAKHSLSRVVRIDPTSGHLTEAPKLPRVLHDAAGTMLNATALLMGGGEQESGYDHVTAVTGAQAGKDLGHLPQPRSDLAAITAGDTAYVIGGYDGKNLPATVLATTDGGATWTTTGVAQLSDTIPTLYGTASATDGSTIVVTGGAVGYQDDANKAPPAYNSQLYFYKISIAYFFEHRTGELL